MQLAQIWEEIRREVERAEAKHRPMASAHEGHSVIREEMDELWEHVRADTGHSPEAQKEAIQIAAMAVRYIRDVVYQRSAACQQSAAQHERYPALQAGSLPPGTGSL